MKQVFPRFARPHTPGWALSPAPSPPFVPSELYPPPKLYLFSKIFKLGYNKKFHMIKSLVNILAVYAMSPCYLVDIELETADELFPELLRTELLLLGTLLW